MLLNATRVSLLTNIHAVTYSNLHSMACPLLTEVVCIAVDIEIIDIGFAGRCHRVATARFMGAAAGRFDFE